MRECGTCHWFDPVEGYCAQLEFYCRGTDGTECEEYQPMRKRRANDGEKTYWEIDPTAGEAETDL